ncbi:hypothetical protein ACA350_00255 [Orientia tsutsugamushi]|uniref:hypothetical protein n=1 Tax=Orientia tsutsugamushi TaxID=784 RepID=UPI0035270568
MEKDLAKIASSNIQAEQMILEAILKSSATIFYIKTVGEFYVYWKRRSTEK